MTGKETPTPSNTDVEMKNMQSNAPKGSIPLGEDIMQLARIGEIGAMQNLFATKKLTANHRDEEGITPLHWAAINNQYAMCKFLLDAGADVNAKGGESVATPAMWAAQRCNYYIVNLLLSHGADPPPNRRPRLQHPPPRNNRRKRIPPRPPPTPGDPGGHLFLRWGANANAVDEGGLTPLHWALVKGSLPCVLKLLEYGADRFAQTRDGKSPSTVAQEMNTMRVWYRALNERGYEPDGTQKEVPMGLAIVRNKSTMAKFFFLWPFLTILLALWMLSHISVFLSIPLTLVTLFGMQWSAQQLANRGPSEYRILQKTPYLAGVFAGTLFWVGFCYVFRVLPATYSSSPILNILFAVFYGLTTYFYIYAMVQDPGYVPKISSRNQQREMVKQLFELWKFDEENFCVPCMSRKPLRSKHCRRCGRCVSKHDHHCPWIDNCVGANNLRHFVLYIVSLEVGIILFVQLTVRYINALPAPTAATCNVINDTLCSYVTRDTFTLVLNIWVILQLVWVTMLCAVQLVQISRNQTTYENMRGHHIDRSYPSSQAFASAMTAGTTSLDAAGLSATGAGPNPALSRPSPPPRRHGNCFSQWSSLLGIDAFFATARDGLREGQGQTVARPRNPFSRDADADAYGVEIRGGGDAGGGAYRSVADEDPERMV
ncbi:hypothetical protein N7509_009776 [Penicillium cosmopolitanum]|uniref:Palmitoyltransferase n=1 Tax=Penicillium cosmopolitanum TaxID=1131564 RepID=A0A9W9VQ78_9EURO|nr:uncharacterized protein N7509_009776 [Penicillium cosmopolitanum]KAJ5387235.1 hypothetical protein N7509_009776 [Penicillium cosmopolitanum]